MMEFIKKWWLYFIIGISGILFYAFALLFGSNTKVDNLFEYLINDIEGKNLLITICLSLGNLFFIAIFIKVLLLHKTLEDVIYEHFKNIFLEKNILHTFSETQLDKIALELQSIHHNIEISFDKRKKESVQLLEDDWRRGPKTKNYIMTECHNSDTIYLGDKNIEIKHKKFYYKMMEDGTFKSGYGFRPFDEILDCALFEHENYNRWGKKNFKYRAERINSPTSNIEINANFSIKTNDKNKKDYIYIDFISHESREVLKKGEEFYIEFSISSPIDFTNIARKDEYFRYEYSQPCGVRTILLQIETYNEKYDDFKPILILNETPIVNQPNESIYYKSWKWEVYYKESKDGQIKISLK